MESIPTWINLQTALYAMITGLVGMLLTSLTAYYKIKKHLKSKPKCKLQRFLEIPENIDDLNVNVAKMQNSMQDIKTDISKVMVRVNLHHEDNAEFSFDSSGRLIYANSAFCKITERTESQLMGQEWFNAIAPKDRERVSDELSTAIRFERSLQTTFNIAGSTTRVLCRAYPVHSTNNIFIAVLNTVYEDDVA